MVRFFVDRPVAVLVIFFALFVLGVTAYLNLPVSLLPETDVPAVTVRVPATEYAAQEVEQRIVAPLRSSLQQVSGLSSIESTASDGVGTIRLRFAYGTDISMAFIEANEKVDLSMDRLPREIRRPIVSKTGVSDIPVFRLNISLHGNDITPARMAELSEFVNDNVRRRIEQLSAVAMVDMTGLTQSQVEIIPKRGYLESLNLGEQALLTVLKENETNLGNILVQDGIYRYFLQFKGGVQDLDGLKETPLHINGRLFRLSDLFTINYTSAEAQGAYFNRNVQAINIAVIMQSSARMDDLKSNFQVLLDRMRHDYPDIDFQLTQDQTQLLDFAIGNLYQDLLLGGLLAFVLMITFVRKLRTALLIGFTVPISLLVSQLAFYLLDISVNIISLGGLILGLSMILDNSIVVIDSISRRRSDGMSISDAAVTGTNEIIRPLIASVLTNCAVFIPLIFLSGLAGVIFYDQAISVVVGVVSSLLVAIILLPPLYRWVHVREFRRGKTWASVPILVNVTEWYNIGLRWSLRHQLTITTLLGLLVAGGVTLFTLLKKQRLPEITRHEMEISIDWNESLDAEEGRRRVMDIVTVFGAAATEINSWVGTQQYILPLIENQDYGQCRMYLRVEDASTVGALQDSIEQYVDNHYPQARLEFFRAENAFDAVFADHLPPLRVKVSDRTQRSMPPLDDLQKLVVELQEALPNARINSVPLNEKIVLTIVSEQAARYGIDPQAVATRIGSAFQPFHLGNLIGGHSYVPIVLSHPQPKSLQQMLTSTHLQTNEGAKVPLSVLVNLSRQKEYKYRTADEQGEYYPLLIYTNQPEVDVRIVERILAQYRDSLESSIDGSYFANQQLLIEMGLVFGISVLLLYFILSAQFESLVQPLFILAELPVAVCGALFMLYLGGSSINLMSMIGIVVMGGLIINDSILKIDVINRLRKEGVPLVKAIYEGGHRRLHSIVMITLTSVGALGPTLIMDDLGSELQRPLGLTLIGGMIVGLLVSLFFLPIVYKAVYHKKERL